MDEDKADLIRKKYLYRRLVQSGRLKLSHRAAVSLVGPDCAYHLYATHASQQTEAPRPLGTRPAEDHDPA